MKTNNMKITALGYDWLKVDNGVSKYIKVNKGGRGCSGFRGFVIDAGGLTINSNHTHCWPRV